MHMAYGPWGNNKEYVWVDLDAENVQKPVENGLTIMVQPNIAYESPVDGSAITTWAKRKYDMEKNGCIDARDGRDCAIEARKNWKTGIEDLKYADLFH